MREAHVSPAVRPRLGRIHGSDISLSPISVGIACDNEASGFNAAWSLLSASLKRRQDAPERRDMRGIGATHILPQSTLERRGLGRWR